MNPLLSARLGAACSVSLHSQEIAVSCTANHDVWAVCPPLIPMDILSLGSINRSTGRHLSFLEWCVSYSVPSLLPKLQIRNCEGPELFLGLQPSKPVGQPDYKYKTPSQRQGCLSQQKQQQFARASHALISTSRHQMSASCSELFRKRGTSSFRRY